MIINTKDSTTTTGGGESSTTTPTREFWSSRTAFYFAASGAAIGFGNVWRFPGLCAKHGGGAFIMPYLFAIINLGLPLAILEIGFGQYFQTGDIGVFGGFHPRLRGVGVCSFVCATMVLSYYMVILGWVMNAFVSSFDDDSPWTNPDLSGEEAINYFYDNIVGLDTVTDADLKPTRIVGKNVAYTALTWAVIYGFTAFGLRTTGRFTYMTMGLPCLLLFVFLGRGITLSGSRDGIVAYIGLWDFSMLTKETWIMAHTQAIFSISVTFGILTSYGSHCKRDEPVLLNAFVVVALNSMYSIAIGFAIFCALGHLAHLNGTDLTDIPYNGFELVFGTWPVVLATLPGGIHWVRLIFFNLFLLGIDSAVSFVEASVTVLQDTAFFRNTSRRTLLIGCILPNFLLGILYCTDAGFFFLDVIDFYVNFLMLLVGFLEASGASWAYGINDVFKNIGAKPTISYMLASFVPGFLYLWVNNNGKLWVRMVVPGVSWIIGLAITHYFLWRRMQKEPGRWTMRSIWYECAFGNIGRLRDEIQPVIGYIPVVWMVWIKNLVPHTCILLFCNLLTSANGAGNYGDYAIRPYQLTGLLCFMFAFFTFFIGFMVPEVYKPLALPQTKIILSGASASEENEFSEGGSLTFGRVRNRNHST